MAFKITRGGADLCRPGTGEVAAGGLIGAFVEFDAADELGNEEIQVRVALAMAVTAHIHRHAVDACGEIRAVVEVKAAEEELIGLAAAAVLRSDQTRHRF